MAILLLGVGLGALAGGCSNETVKRVKGLADEACACTDAACGDAVEKKYLALVKEGQKRGNEDDRKEVEAAYARMRECIAKARAAGPGAEGAEAGGAADGAGAAGSGAAGEGAGAAGGGAAGGAAGGGAAGGAAGTEAGGGGADGP